MIDHTDSGYAGRGDCTETTPDEGEDGRLSHDSRMALQANASHLHRRFTPGVEVWTGHDQAGQFVAATLLGGGFDGALVTFMPRVTTVVDAPRSGSTQGAANDGPILRRH